MVNDPGKHRDSLRGFGAQMGASKQELENGEVNMPPLNINVRPPELAALTEKDLEKQMEESVQMQVEEFRNLESPLGFKIPKMPDGPDALVSACLTSWRILAGARPGLR